MAIKDDLNISAHNQFDYKTDIVNEIEFDFGLNEDVIKQISKYKNEPEWMLEQRLKAYENFVNLPMPDFGPSLKDIDFDQIKYFVKATDKANYSWDDVPEKIKETFDKIGVPEAEKQYLAGLTAQMDSEAVYHNTKKYLDEHGIIFVTTDQALQEHEELFKQYFGKLVSNADNKFAALNAAVWSGGSFIYVPKNVKLDEPIQSYFRINTQSSGQFERTLIIIDEGADITYIEGCTAPNYTTNNLHAATVEIFVKKDAKFRYTTIQNWSDNVYNLVTKRAIAYENSLMEWIDGNIGSGITMKYPAVILAQPYAKGLSMSIALASRNQKQDVGAKMIHLAPHTQSNIISKSISRTGGDVIYRGWTKFSKDAKHSTSHIECDTLILDDISTSDTIPYNEINNPYVNLEHEAKVSKVSEEQLYYLMSRGLSEQEATEMIILGFIQPYTRELPMEYAVELNRLIKYEFDGTLG